MRPVKILLCSLLLAAITASCVNKHWAENKQAFKNVTAVDTAGAAASLVHDIKTDAAFAIAAADAAMTNIALGKLALQKGISRKIGELGAMMVKDFGNANDELMAAASAKGIKLSSVLSDKSQQKLQKVAEVNGAAFDSAFANLVAGDRKEDIPLFRNEAAKGNDLLLSSWAKLKIYVLENHLKMAQQAKNEVGTDVIVQKSSVQHKQEGL